MKEPARRIKLNSILGSITLGLVIAIYIAIGLAEATDVSLSKIDDSELHQIGQSTNPRCGPLSLLVIAELLGVKADIDELSRLSGITDQGVTMYGLYQVAQTVGLSVRGMRLSLDELCRLNLPAILHLNGTHFVVLERFIGEDARIIDYGRVYFLSKDQLSKIWDGNALVMSRGKPELDQNEEAPDIIFRELVYDFGEVYRDEIIEHDFEFQNIGKKDLFISHIETHCTCTATLLAQKNISPGSLGIIRIKLNTSNKIGAVSESIKVYSNASNEPLVYITVVGLVNPIPVAIPARIYLGAIPVKKCIEKTVKVMGTIEQGFKVVGIESTSNYIMAKMIPFNDQNDQQDTKILIKLSTDIPIGVIKEKLIIYTNNMKKPKIEIPIDGEVIGEITIFPKRFFFGIINKGETRSIEIEISKAGENNLEIISARASSEFISIKCFALQKGSKYTIEATVSKDAPPGTIRDSIEIHTNNSDQPIINISFYAFVSDQ